MYDGLTYPGLNIGLLCSETPSQVKAVFLLVAFSDVNKFRWVCDQTLQWKYTNAFPEDAKLWGKNGTRLFDSKKETSAALVSIVNLLWHISWETVKCIAAMTLKLCCKMIL